MERFPLNKILWRDGDVVTEHHFQSFENWIESNFGLMNQSGLKYGLFRNVLFQDYYNKPMNISFHHIEGSKYRVDIEYLQGVNQGGKIFKIDDKREFKLEVEFTKSDEEGRILVYLLPKHIDRNNSEEYDRISEEIETGTPVYQDQYILSTSNTNNEGIPIFRFLSQGNILDRDESFIPFGLYINSSSSSIIEHKKFCDELTRYRKLLADYISTQRPDHEPLYWTASTNILRLLSNAEKYLYDNTFSTIDFIRHLSSLFTTIQTELYILSVARRGEFITQKTSDVIDILKKSLVRPIEQQYDLSFTFVRALQNLEALAKYLEYLPAGPISEKELPISNIRFTKIAGWNKLIVSLKENISFEKGKSLMTIYLRSFTRAEPIHKNARVGLGDVPPAHLKDYQNIVRPIKDERHSYRLECPKEAVDRSEAQMISIYIPPPMGENVPDIDSNVVITIRSI